MKQKNNKHIHDSGMADMHHHDKDQDYRAVRMKRKQNRQHFNLISAP